MQRTEDKGAARRRKQNGTRNPYAVPMTGFEEVSDLNSLGMLVGVRVDDDVDQDAVLALLRTAPNADEYLTIIRETPALPPGTLGLVFAKTRVFFNLTRCNQLWGDAVVALAVYAMTQSGPAAFFAATVRKLYDNIALLSDDEAEVVRDFFALSSGNPYRTPIQETVLSERFARTSIAVDDVLDRLERKGIVVSHRGGGLTLAL